MVSTSKQQEPIAIVGSACRFPGGANSPSALWKLLKIPHDVGVDIGSDRFNAPSFYHPDGSHHGTSNVLRSYLLQEDVRVFDAAFFNLSPNEADSMDPQQRVLLEVVYEALEAGGHTLEALRGSDTAVYVGTMTADYNDTLIRDHNSIPNYFATGTNRAIISNRVSYFFDWHGPSMTIDTACSSSLIAVHQGVKALRTSESRVALACGTQILLNPEMYIGESKLKMLSPNGRSRMWDADADGYARGEGVAAVVLKRLSDAIADGDHIECIIRETGANQDGFSNGITVPSTDAQALLIRQTYARAGLDPKTRPWDRPQFFEAHGTGTQAGDPKEAEAIHRCFGKHIDSSADPLFVGSVKTVIGHLEGCAGLAGLLKGSAMIQAGFVAPNLHFHRLNPRIEPFYKGLEVPTQLSKWPELPEGVPRRVSVNSFGFGGTNAHAILEQYQPQARTELKPSSSSISPTPFVFSGSSEPSLVAQLQTFSRYLKAHHATINHSDLAWTLHSRRSQLSTRAAFSATTLEQLASNIEAKLEELNQNAGTTIGVRATVKSGTSRLLGIFTGQGAQWPAMGAELIRSSSFVRRMIQHMEDSLATLPESDRPAWSLHDEMLAGQHVSRVGEAALSQPLCTAVQLVLVDLLRSAGITFTAVVGHSSGEIAAAYAAGFISARDAIRIAYYRGFYARLAGNERSGQKVQGAMMAVGTSWEDAQQCVNSSTFKGRLAVAAHNSPASVTLSGDADAIEEAKKVFDAEKKFARVLRVDVAYHSHHMLSCGERYVQALRACGVRVNRDRSDASCTWFSSVVASNKGMEPIDALQDMYWRDNMTSAVLFAEALQNAVANVEQLDLAIEIGPHPALKGPATQNVSEVRSSPLPYCGVLGRGKNDVEAFSEALGFLWVNLPPRSVDLASFERNVASAESSQPRLLAGLPSYQWNHARSHWSESRISKRMRTRKQPHHDILGFLSPDSNPHDMRWLNVLKPKELPWLEGHQLQGQTVFPAAGYVAMALEASRVLAGDKAVAIFELHKLNIRKAITFEEGDNSGVETLVSLTEIEHHLDGTATSSFTCYSIAAVTHGSEQDMELTASGNVKIIFGSPGVATLSCTPPDDYNLSEVDADHFYATISELGYNYSGAFRTLSSAKRRLNTSYVLVDSYDYLDTNASEYLIHPSVLDVAFQASILAYSVPGDGRLWSLSVPTSIGTIRVNPEVCAALPTAASRVPVYAMIDSESESFSATIDILSEDGEHGMVQVEDLALKPFASATKADDRVMFTHTKFDLAQPDGTAAVNNIRPSAYEVELATVCERISYYFLNKWKSQLSNNDWVNRILYNESSGQRLKKQWSADSLDAIQALINQYSDSIDVKILTETDRRLSAKIRGDTVDEHKLQKDMLDTWYENGLGFSANNSFLVNMLKQIVHRYPHARFLEIGAGAGKATKSILASIGDKLSSYTYTDLSEEYVANAEEEFKLHSDKMTFTTLDIEADVTNQGFQLSSYDIVVASNVLTSTASLETALQNTRKLIKPGGYLFIADITNPSSLRCHSILGSVPGLWSNVNTDRASSPLITMGEWHFILRKTGFSGVDAYTPDIEATTWPLSVIASQASDDRIKFLRRPLSSPPLSNSLFFESLVILGSGSFESACLSEQLAEHLGRFCGEITVLRGLPTEMEASNLNPMSTFINLLDIESPILKNITDEVMDGIKRMLELAKQIVWITHRGHIDQPYQMASIAFGRTIRQEFGHINFGHMDVSDLQHDVSKSIAEYLLQQCTLDEWAAPLSTLSDKQHSDFEFLWSREPEVFLDNGKMMLPRLVENTDQNARLNSSRRVITKRLPISETNVTIISSLVGSPRLVVDQVGRRRSELSDVLVRVRSSSSKALHITADTFLFLGVGKNKDGLLRVLLSLSNSSETTAVASVAAPANAVSDGNTDALLVAVASDILAKSLARKVSTGSHILIHCSGKDRFLAAALRRRAAEKAVAVTFTCESQDKQRDESWICLNARSPTHIIRKMLRRANPSHFVDFTAGSSLGDLGFRIAQALPASSTAIATSSLFRHEASSLPLTYDRVRLENQLRHAVSTAEMSLQDEVQDVVVHLRQLRTLNPGHAIASVHWPLDETLEVEVRPIDERSLFSKEKTYLLVGLSGQIGQSLCEWMVSNGAGCVCLTSRRPKVDNAWLDSFRETGATVKVMALDVLDVGSLKRVVEDIRASCPPIGGVANGAVIFDDQLFANMSRGTMSKVLGPKIDGSNNLDDVFYNDDLDFFVLFSSAVSVFGNAGQSNYAAANGYLDGLVRQRRRRGLAASSIDLGRVTGIGYAESAGQAVQEQLVKKLGLPPVSETDLHRLIGETILAGFPQPRDLEAIPQAVVTTGLRVVDDDEDLRGPWFSNPFFSHMVRESSRTTSAFGAQNEDGMLPISQRLAMAGTREDSLVILQESLATKLGIMLQLGNQKIEHDAPLLELGIDSLVAVELRSWFLKELKVDIPVLKIVSGASLTELCERAIEKLPVELVLGAEKQQNSTKPLHAVVVGSHQDLQLPELTQKPPLDSESSSASRASGRSTPQLHSRRTAMATVTTVTTPSSGSISDSHELDSPKLKSSNQSPRKFIKSERISLPQSRFWFLRHLLEDPTTPNVVFTYHVTGYLRVGDLERAIRVVSNRHEALRTCFVEDETDAGEAYQKILPSSPLRLERKKMNSKEDVDSERKKQGEHVFELENGDVMRLVVLTQSSESHYLLINYHHIVMDGASFNVFLSDLEKAYNGKPLGAPPRQYPEFSAAQRRALENGDMDDELKYWQTVFPSNEQPPILPLLPMSRTSSRIAMKGFDSHQVLCHLQPDLVARIKLVSRAQRSTPFNFHLAAFKTLLFCFAGKDTTDLTIGIADAARNDGGVNGSIGFFLNLLALRFRRHRNQTFADAIVEARDTAHAALGSSRLPFDMLLKELKIARSSLHSPFFQAFLDYRQGIHERHPWGNCQFELQDVHPGRTAYDVTLDVTDGTNADTLVMFRVQKSLYDLEAAELLMETYVHIVDVLTRDAMLPLEEIPLFSETQLTRSAQVGRGIKMISDWPSTLPHRIDQVAKDNQNSVALMDGRGRSLTYSDMVNRIEAISEALLSSGTGAGSRVLVYQQPTTDWTCSMLAIMRIGAVYVPLDLRNPISRLSTVAKDCKPSTILADATTILDAPLLQAAGASIINMSELPPAATSRIVNQADPASPAAILYTSGSTGTPKGIMVTHAGLRNEIEGYTKTWGLGAERVLQQSAFTFNHSSDQMYTGLVNGGMVYIVPAEKRGDPLEITKIIHQQGITYTKATPSEYSLWMQYGGDTLRQATSWHFAFGGGEPLTSTVTQEFSNLNLHQLRFFNSYGPTEISISSHKMEIPYHSKEVVDSLGRIPCGYSLPNYHTYIVDEQLRPVPVGMPGEICLGGAGVSLGYLNNENLTAKHFVPNPFATPEDVAQGWTRMYRTGDIGHLRSDGATVFHGRMAGDSQVKIRGLRIELSDIESNIIAASGGALREAVVTLREGNPPFLVAHVVFTSLHGVADKDAFLQDLLSRLPIPQYMIPVVAISLDSFPLSNHSKVDRKAVQRMPLPERVVRVKQTADLSETMVQLKRVWGDVLGKNLEKFGFDLNPSTNFFLVGGNSLLAIRLQAHIRQVFHVAITLVKLLGISTLGEMAAEIENCASVDLIDWEQETSLPPIPSFVDAVPSKNLSSAKTILITGSTGFLGKYLLPLLASRSDIETIHCVAVRDKPRDRPLFTSPKVAYHAGDLSLPLLGLGHDKFNDLSSQVDAVLHMGAVRSFWDNYHVLRPSNVDSVKELIKLAAPRRVPIHYISTIGVLPRNTAASTVNNAGSATDHVPPTDGSNGYVASKWAVEQILERAAEGLGIPSRVYRFLPASQKQALQKQELLDAIVRAVDSSNLVPDMSVWKGRVDLVPADEIAQWLGDSIIGPVTLTAAGHHSTTVQFVHYESPTAIHTDELSAHIEQQRGGQTGLESVPVLKWFGCIKALGFNYLLASQEAVITDSNGSLALESRR